ncbi:hypothetical protein AB0M45_07955 [Nocardia sp. NPDC051787]|uniref:hypothetical protein n=1 Tax=Nocardia sp. NPDC051787 TaxID=3155415 RepID=UPI00343F3D5D
MRKGGIRTTETGDGRKTAYWRLLGRSAYVIRFRVNDDGSTAYRFPGNLLPAVQPGTVLFDTFPDLAQAREWFPEHHDLWNTVRDDYWSTLLDSADLPAGGLDDR